MVKTLQKFFFTLFCVLIFSEAFGQEPTVTFGSLDPGPYARGSSIAVPFTMNDPDGRIAAESNKFQIWLYKANGSGVQVSSALGEYAGHYATFVNGKMHTSVPPGSYQIRIRITRVKDAAGTEGIKEYTCPTPITVSAGSAVKAELEATIGQAFSDRTSTVQAFGQCTGSPYNNFKFKNASADAAGTSLAAMATIQDAFDPTNIRSLSLNQNFFADLTHYTIFVKALRQGINLFDKVILAWLGGLTAFITLLVWYFSVYLSKDEISLVSKIVSNLLLFLIPVAFILGALRKKVNVFDTFIEGAKAGFETTVKIIPYLVAMLAAISVFRYCGALTYIIDGIKWVVASFGADTRFTDALPVALMKPLTGSGSKAMMIDTMTTFGPDSFPGRLGSIFNGSADTTFYIVALYFGSVGIKKSRYAIQAGLIADLAGVIAAILVAYLFFG
jgi:spore maturation protein SpmB